MNLTYHPEAEAELVEAVQFYEQRLPGLGLMPFGNSVNHVSRRDSVKIARRFNAGNDGPEGSVPKGRLKSCVEASGDSSVPSGLVPVGSCHPALKRRAIVACPSGTNTRANSRKALGLGHHFRHAYEATVRRCLIRGFPYSIYYRVLDDALRILAVKHHHSHPDYWKDRASE